MIKTNAIVMPYINIVSVYIGSESQCLHNQSMYNSATF